jgi:hypothetical protein
MQEVSQETRYSRFRWMRSKFPYPRFASVAVELLAGLELPSPMGARSLSLLVSANPKPGEPAFY